MPTVRLRVAIADDDRSMRRILSQLLHELGHEVVVEADNGRKLVEQCSVMLPDVVITDNVMPDMSGTDAAAEIHSRDGTPVLLLSAYSDRDFVLTAEQCHVMHYLVKPIEKSVLEAALACCRSRETSEQDEWIELPPQTDLATTTPRTPSRRPSRAGHGHGSTS